MISGQHGEVQGWPGVQRQVHGRHGGVQDGFGVHGQVHRRHGGVQGRSGVHGQVHGRHGEVQGGSGVSQWASKERITECSPRKKLAGLLGAVYTYTISHTNQCTICCKSDGYTILCTIRKQSVYTRYDFAYKLAYDLVHLSPRKAKMTFPGIERQKLNRVQFGTF
jgi:hypothetical protein